MVILIQVWDLRKMALYWETNVGNGVCGVEWDRRDIEVIVLSFKLINIYASSSYMEGYRNHCLCIDQPHLHHYNHLHQINKLAAVTLEGGLHVWDCSTLSQEGKFAEVNACSVVLIKIVMIIK